MSATQDKTQKVAFVYSNLYQIYRKGKDAAQKAELPVASPLAVPGRKSVLKSEDLRAKAAAQAEPAPRPAVIQEYRPAEFIGKRVARPAVIPPRPQQIQQREAIDSLKQNLKSLNDLHSRLRFMLLEIEDLVKE